MILISYPKFVGGKFISNCLALSRHCVAQDFRIAKMDIALTGKEQYYDFKLKSVLKTLPRKENLSQWFSYEYGCQELYGISEEFYQQESISNIKKHINELSIITALDIANKESCLIAHDYRTLLKYQLVYPGAKIIEFKNFRDFRKIAANLKSTSEIADYNSSEEYYTADQGFFQLESFTISVDDTFFNWDKFNIMMQELYQYLGFDDYCPELVQKFWEPYISLHK